MGCAAGMYRRGSRSHRGQRGQHTRNRWNRSKDRCELDSRSSERSARLLENLDRIPNVKLREKLAANRERIDQNRQMVRLELDHELPVPVTDLKIRPDYPAYVAGLKKCEFRTLAGGS